MSIECECIPRERAACCYATTLYEFSTREILAARAAHHWLAAHLDFIFGLLGLHLMNRNTRVSSRFLVLSLLLLLVAASSARIVSTYWVFNHTIDEPTHIACGLEWLQNHTYTYEYQHPPLSRILAAVGPWLRGTTNIQSKAELPSRNPLVLYQSNSYYGTLVSARAGELVFFVLAVIIVFKWARRLHGDWAGLLSALLFSVMPAVLGHSGLATTDASLMATLPMALYSLELWLQYPTVLRSCVLGASVGLGLASKFSFVLFFPVCAVVIVICRITLLRRLSLKSALQGVLASAACAFMLIWGIYFFRLGHVPLVEGPGGVLSSVPTWALNSLSNGESIRIPLGELYLGLVEVREHNLFGHMAYLLGETKSDGWWFFFPVVLFYKTPLAFWILMLFVLCSLMREPLSSAIPLLCALAIVVVVLPSRINLGVRHVLPVYPLMAISAGFIAVRFLTHRRMVFRLAAVFLFGWLLSDSIRSHPDYLAYFNELAFDEPELIRVDSDLDWGQNIDRLSRRIAEKKITEPVGLALFGSVNPSWHNLNWYPLSPWVESKGWIAVSATEKMMSQQTSDAHLGKRPWAWLYRHEPVERIGNSILLYYIR